MAQKEPSAPPTTRRPPPPPKPPTMGRPVLMSPVTDGGRNPSYSGRFPDETPEMHLVRLAQARRIAELEADLAETKSFVSALQGLHAGDVQTLKAQRDAALTALCMIYEKYEDGGQCFEGPDCDGSYMGNAVHLDADEENQILALIPKEHSATPNAQGQRAAEPSAGPTGSAATEG